MRMRNLVASVAILSVTMAAQAAAPLAQRVPAGSLVYVGWAGKTEAFSKSSFGKLIDDPAFKEILDGIHKAITNVAPDGPPREMFTKGWSMAGTIWNRPCAIAMIAFDQLEGEFMPSVVFFADLGKQRDDFAKDLDALLKAIDEEVIERQEGDVQYKVMKVLDDRELAMGYVGELFFACFGGAELPKQLLSLKADKSLAAEKRFADAVKAVSGDGAQLIMYEDIEGVIKAMDKVAAQDKPGQDEAKAEIEEAKKVLTAMGLGKATVVAAATHFLEDGVYTKAKMFTPAPHESWLKLPGKPIEDSDLALVPADADYACVVNFSAAEAYAELKRFIKAVAPDEDKEFEERIAEVEKKMGVSLDKEIFASLGDTWVLSSAESQGGFITGTLLAVEVKDADVLKAAIKKIEDYLINEFAPPKEAKAPQEKSTMTLWTCSMHPHVRMGGPGTCPICNLELVPIEVPMFDGPPMRQRGNSFEIKTMKAAGAEIRYVGASVSHFPLPVSPAWAIHDGRLYFALWPQVIAAAIENPPVDEKAAEVARTDVCEKMLTQTAAFRKVRGKLSKDASLLAYVNTRRIVDRLYPLALAGWTMGANALQTEASVPGAQPWLPSLPRIRKYLGPYMAAVSTDEAGITYEEFGSLPFQGMAGPGTSGFMAGMLFWTTARTGGMVGGGGILPALFLLL